MAPGNTSGKHAVQGAPLSEHCCRGSAVEAAARSVALLLAPRLTPLLQPETNVHLILTGSFANCLQPRQSKCYLNACSAHFPWPTPCLQQSCLCCACFRICGKLRSCMPSYLQQTTIIHQHICYMSLQTTGRGGGKWGGKGTLPMRACTHASRWISQVPFCAEGSVLPHWLSPSHICGAQAAAGCIRLAVIHLCSLPTGDIGSMSKHRQPPAVTSGLKQRQPLRSQRCKQTVGLHKRMLLWVLGVMLAPPALAGTCWQRRCWQGFLICWSNWDTHCHT